MFVDSHCHLEMESFDEDRVEVVEKGLAEGLDYILTVGTEERYFEKVNDLVDRFPAVYGAIGIHPHNSNEFNDTLATRVESFLGHEKIVAYGEIGLDFFRNYAPREAQIRSFERQIELALANGLPIIVHSREAKEDTLAVLGQAMRASWTGVIHCYSYDVATARRFLDMGFHLSIPGTITYKNGGDLADVVRYTPADRLLCETDAPFLTPVPHRGKRNEPRFVKFTVARMAEIKATAAPDLCRTLCDNFVNLFMTGRQGRNR